ncbi:MAG: hypothetical protein APF76_17175 [Desulfitibacter sp. BRH_c19]|nr:MAG: hypothetical protein APF76_17175 [Desulfitibacter sp. BRH_c19]
MKSTLNQILGKLNIITGGTVILMGIYKFFIDRSSYVSLYIALAIIIVGPVEDYFNKLIKDSNKTSKRKELLYQRVDLTTSLIFLILLGLVLLET